MSKKITRRTFLKLGLSGIASLLLDQFPSSALAQIWTPGSKARPQKSIKTEHDLVVVKGKDPYAITRKAIEGLGGIERFVKKGDIVVVKPNMAWDRAPEYAANTNPQVVGAIVELCLDAGAKRVNVFDIPCNSAQRCYENSGIMKEAKNKGADVYFVDRWNFVKAQFGYESPMQDWPVFRDAVECDTFINVPIAKHHGLTRLTLSMKNLMGVCGGSRGLIHVDIGRKLVDLADFIKPDLTVVDAYRVLTDHGPSGGDTSDVKLLETVYAATDPVLADSYGCKLMGVDPLSVVYLAEAIERGFGNPDLKNSDVFELYS